MMKNKKLAALLGVLLAGSMAVSMAACGSSNNASDTKASTSSSDTAKKDDSAKLMPRAIPLALKRSRLVLPAPLRSRISLPAR